LHDGGSSLSYEEHLLDISTLGSIYLPPIISSFVGPDITSGILATRLQDKEQVTLFVDIGTNGEMVLSDHGELTATSTAAGPAFEGMNISYGMRAEKGAIEYFEIDDHGEIYIRTIVVAVCWILWGNWWSIKLSTNGADWQLRTTLI
jgi:uncharacterized 2Fe-2S/4Fe-4S cluster protein (DUF4445 family)